MKTFIHQEKYIMLSEIEGIPQEALEFFENEKSFVMNVQQEGKTCVYFFETEDLGDFIESSHICENSAFEKLSIRLQNCLETIYQFCLNNNISKIWF